MSDNNAQRRARSFKLPVEDLDFLLRDEMRDIRFALEYAKADLLLHDWGIRSTIIVFGSARTPSPEQAEAAMAAATTMSTSMPSAPRNRYRTRDLMASSMPGTTLRRVNRPGSGGGSDSTKG